MEAAFRRCGKHFFSLFDPATDTTFLNEEQTKRTELTLAGTLSNTVIDNTKYSANQQIGFIMENTETWRGNGNLWEDIGKRINVEPTCCYNTYSAVKYAGVDMEGRFKWCPMLHSILIEAHERPEFIGQEANYIKARHFGKTKVCYADYPTQEQCEREWIEYGPWTKRKLSRWTEVELEKLQTYCNQQIETEQLVKWEEIQIYRTDVDKQNKFFQKLRCETVDQADVPEETLRIMKKEITDWKRMREYISVRDTVAQ